MSKAVPWYLQPPTEEECRKCATDPWCGVPEHLRPQFLETETERKCRLALEAAEANAAQQENPDGQTIQA